MSLRFGTAFHLSFRPFHPSLWLSIQLPTSSHPRLTSSQTFFPSPLPPTKSSPSPIKKVQGVHRCTTLNPSLHFCLSRSTLAAQNGLKFCLGGNLCGPERVLVTHTEINTENRDVKEEQEQRSVGNVSSAVNLSTLQRWRYR